jgi:hypothetical protein
LHIATFEIGVHFRTPGGVKMTGVAGRQRQGKKRVLANVLNAMFRLDAIYPDMETATHAFSSLIIMSKLLLDDGRVHPAETRMLTRFVSPHIKLRRDDTEFVCEQITERGMTGEHVAWLASYVKSGMTPDRKASMREAFDRAADSGQRLRPAEILALDETRRLFGLD